METVRTLPKGARQMGPGTFFPVSTSAIILLSLVQFALRSYSMAQILIRGLENEVVARLKERATLHGRSLESEARTILETATGFSAEEALKVVHSWQRRLKDRKMSNSGKLLRKDRQR
jgi:antitoxin FitA